jgi:hypothetical protein
MKEMSFIPTKWDLPVLPNYRGKADENFWALFPKKEIVPGPRTEL